nr:hypothetical protein [Tanacetum cinerariifolium]
MQQDIYAAGSESRPPMLNKENYVPWSSRLLRYAKSRPNRKLIHNSIINGPYTDDELTKKKLKQIEADDQAIQTILLGLPEDIYVAVDSCETAQEIWLRVQQLMKGSDIGIQEKKAKLFNEWERFTSNEGESIESYYHQWSQHVTIVHQTKDLHTADYTQLYDFLKYNQKENVRNQVVQNPRVQNIGNHNGLIGVPGNANQNLNRNGNLLAARAEGNAFGHNSNKIRCYNSRGVGHFARNCTVRLKRRDAAYLQTQLLIAQKEEAGIQLQGEEFDLIAAAADLDEIEEVNANWIWMANLQQASTSEEQYTELLEPIPKPHQVPQNDHNVISEVTSVEQSGEIVEQHPVNFEETRALYDSLYQNLAIEVKKVNSMQMVGGNGENQFRQYVRQNVGNLNGYNTVKNVGVQGNGNQNHIKNGNLVAVRTKGNAAGHNGNQIRCYNCRGVGHFARSCTVRPRRRDAAYLHTQLVIAQKEEAGIQLQAEEFDLMAAAADLDEIEEVNANYGSAEVHNHENCYDDDIFNMFIQEEQYTELLKPIPESYQVPQNDKNVISDVASVEQGGETVEQHSINV